MGGAGLPTRGRSLDAGRRYRRLRPGKRHSNTFLAPGPGFGVRLVFSSFMPPALAVAMDVLQAKLRHRHRSGFNRAGGEAGLRTWSLLCIYPWCVYTLAPITVVTNTLSSFRLTPSPRPGVEESG